jgi:hypothetical protein
VIWNQNFLPARICISIVFGERINNYYLDSSIFFNSFLWWSIFQNTIQEKDGYDVRSNGMYVHVKTIVSMSISDVTRNFTWKCYFMISQKGGFKLSLVILQW